MHYAYDLILTGYSKLIKNIIKIINANNSLILSFVESCDCLLAPHSLNARNFTRNLCHLGLFSLKIFSLHFPYGNVWRNHNLQVFIRITAYSII